MQSKNQQIKNVFFKVKTFVTPSKTIKKCSHVLLAAVPCCEHKADHPTQHSDMLANGPLPP